MCRAHQHKFNMNPSTVGEYITPAETNDGQITAASFILLSPVVHDSSRVTTAAQVSANAPCRKFEQVRNRGAAILGRAAPVRLLC